MDMKRDYFEDVRVIGSGVVLFWCVVFILFLALFPFLFKNYYVYMANYMAINVIVAIGLNLLVGYTGQISLGHAGFFAIGAYGTVVLMAKASFPFLLALPLAALATALFGFLLGLPALRLEGPYLSIATLGFGLTITQVIGRIDFFWGSSRPAHPGFGHRPMASRLRQAVLLSVDPHNHFVDSRGTESDKNQDWPGLYRDP